MQTPPYLKKGDIIGITCPAGYMEIEKIKTCMQSLQQWGFKVTTGNTLGQKQQNYFSGTDEDRLDDLQRMLDDDNISAILCGRGGYGISRIIDNLSFKKFKRQPKWILGYSDITLLHAHLNNHIKIASIHAPMAAAFNDGVDNIYIQSIKKALLGNKLRYTVPAHAYNQPGIVEGRLFGGNLALLAHAIGSKDEPKLKHNILFLEDVGEYLYNIDRMFIQLMRAGWFKHLGGLILGTFSDAKDTPAPFGKKVEDIFKEHLSAYDFPYCFNFPVGHTQQNLALKCGLHYQLAVQKKKVQLIEL